MALIPENNRLECNLKIIFSKDFYTNVYSKNKTLQDVSLTAIFQIVHQNMERAENYIANLKSAQTLLNKNHKWSFLGLSPLDVAVLTRRHELLACCLERLQKDHVDVPSEILRWSWLLKDEEANKMIQAAMKGNRVAQEKFVPDSWMRVLNPKYPKDEEVIAIRKHPESGNIEPITARQFRELTGASYYNGIVGDRKRLIDLLIDGWLLKQKMASQDSNEEASARIFHDYFMNCQFDALPPEKQLFCLGSQGKAGWGLQTARALKEGECCGLYGGDIQPVGSDIRYSYVNHELTAISATRIKNAISLMNHSFPNVALHPVVGKDGLIRIAVIPLADIPSGSPIYYAYGPDYPLLKDVFLELNQKELIGFLKGGLDPILKQMQEGENLAIQAVGYLLSSPTPIFRMALLEVLSIQEWKRFISENQQFLKTLYPSVNFESHEVLQSKVVDFLEQIEKASPHQEVKKILKRFVLSSLDQHLVQTIFLLSPLLFCEKEIQDVDIEAWGILMQQCGPIVDDLIKQFLHLPEPDPVVLERLKRQISRISYNQAFLNHVFLSLKGAVEKNSMASFCRFFGKEEVQLSSSQSDTKEEID